MKTITVAREQAAKLCLELSGGGYTVQQTARSMEAHRTLLTKKEVKIGKVLVKLEEAA